MSEPEILPEAEKPVAKKVVKTVKATAEKVAAKKPMIDTAALKAGAEKVKARAEKVKASAEETMKAGTEKVVAAATKAKDYSKGNVDAVVASMTAANKGATALRVQSFALPQVVFKESLSAGKTLTTAKSVEDVVDVYGKFATTMLNLHLSEVKKASATMTQSFFGAVAPIKARVELTLPRKAA